MTAVVMLYALVVGLMLAVAALLADRAAALRHAPRRWIWGTALAAAFALPGVALWRESAIGLAGADTGASGMGQAVSWFVATARLSDGLASTALSARPYDGWLAAGWAVASGAAAVMYAAGAMSLARRRRQWDQHPDLGHDVLAAPDAGPAVVGLISPAVVLPTWALALDRGSLEVVVRHEREHIRARDPWLVHAAFVAVVLTPWNPFVWWIAARLRLAVEFDCDARVLASQGAEPAAVSRYGELLLSVAARQPARVPLAAPALFESSSTLTRRIAAMCPRSIRFVRTKMAFAGLGAAVCLAAACSTPLPTAASDEPSLSANGPSFDSPGVVRPGTGVVNPRVVDQVRPSYTSEAMRRRLAGEVVLEALVGVDGAVHDVRVVKSLDREFGLDEAAVNAAKAWRFEPAVVDGKPVPIVVTLVLSFTVR